MQISQLLYSRNQKGILSNKTRTPLRFISEKMHLEIKCDNSYKKHLILIHFYNYSAKAIRYFTI